MVQHVAAPGATRPVDFLKRFREEVGSTPCAPTLLLDAHLPSGQHWAQFQLDSMGLVSWFYYRLANEKVLSLPALSRALTKFGAAHENVESIFCLWLKGLHAMRYYEQSDFGPWEDYRLPQRGTSIGLCAAGFREARTFFEMAGWDALPHCSGNKLKEIVTEGYERGLETLFRRIPPDGSFVCETERFPADAALTLLLVADPGLNRAQQDAIIRMVCRERMGQIGITRRPEDTYVGSDYPHREGNEGIWADSASPHFKPAEWCLFDCIIGTFLCERASATGNVHDVRLAERFLRRAIAHVTPREDTFLRVNDNVQVTVPAFSVPEAYWYDNRAKTFRPNHNTPLLMGQGALARLLKTAWSVRRDFEMGSSPSAA